ncbi:MAG TPA: hypothetical protein VKI44_05430 [Acetobacteraceae bacterium]|nr:hypothetical protein [Acetobacteraceae bacterium]
MSSLDPSPVLQKALGLEPQCQRKQMVVGTVSTTLETTVESQLSATVGEGDF